MKANIQNSNINIRIPKKLKDRFIEITKEKCISYSSVIRNMIKDYIKSDCDTK